MSTHNIVIIKVIMNLFQRKERFYFTSFIYIKSSIETPAIKSVYINRLFTCIEILTTAQWLGKNPQNTYFKDNSNLLPSFINGNKLPHSSAVKEDKELIIILVLHTWTPTRHLNETFKAVNCPSKHRITFANPCATNY